MPKNKKGFTLIELLLVIGIIAVLAVVVFVALNPAQRFKDARDARRNTDVETILSAIHTSLVDNKGTFPSGLSAGMSEAQLGTAASGCVIATGGCSVTTGACLDMTTALVKYLKTIPIDPNGTAASTKYAIVVDANGIVSIKACGTEGTTTISASRRCFLNKTA
ncbi:MAG: type II secretion system protein [Patescibacteria group bacterium]